MNTKSFALGLLIAATAMAFPAWAQKKKNDVKPASTTQAPPKADEKKGGPQPYRKLVTAKTKTQRGLFTVHKNGDDYFFEIPDTIMNREFIAISRISKTPTGAGYGGEEENRQVLRWDRGPGNKVFLRGVLYINASVKATVVRVLTFTNYSSNDFSLVLKELQPRLQLTEEQFNIWSVKQQALLVEFGSAQKTSLIHIAPQKITDRFGWIPF